MSRTSASGRSIIRARRGGSEHRFQWVSPFLLSPHDPDTLYTGGEVVFKSTDQGHSWNAISPDLTRNDKSKQKPSGGPITNDITSVEYYDTIFALAESPLKKGMLWAGTDDGLASRHDDDGAHWTNVTPQDAGVELGQPDRCRRPSTPERLRRGRSPPARRHQALHLQDHDPGKTWTAITNGIPDGAYVHAVREDPKRRGLLYAGTDSAFMFRSTTARIGSRCR